MPSSRRSEWTPRDLAELAESLLEAQRNGAISLDPAFSAFASFIAHEFRLVPNLTACWNSPDARDGLIGMFGRMFAPLMGVLLAWPRLAPFERRAVFAAIDVAVGVGRVRLLRVR